MSEFTIFNSENEPVRGPKGKGYYFTNYAAAEIAKHKCDRALSLLLGVDVQEHKIRRIKHFFRPNDYNVLCLNGNAHREVAMYPKDVTCPKCLEILNAQKEDNQKRTKETA